MALTYAILSVLADRPQSKNDIIKYFENSLGFFWKASHQQIYAELETLERQGWINVDRNPQQRYRLNPLGRRQLTEWINKSCELRQIQDDFLVKLLADSSTNLSVIQQKLTRCQQRHLEKLLLYQIIEEQCFSNSQQRSTTKIFSCLTLQQSICHEQEWIEWCYESISTLKILQNRANQQKLIYDFN